MDDELAIVLREHGFGEIQWCEDESELVNRIVTKIDGEVADDFTFDFNEFFAPSMIHEVVEAHVVRRFSYCKVNVTLERN